MSASAPAIAAIRLEPLALCFKGERDYLQGGDLVEAVSGVARRELGSRVARFQVAVHRFFRAQPDLHWGMTNDARGFARPAAAGADFTVLADGPALCGWLSESTRAVDRRVPFDEPGIAARCKIDGDAIALRAQTGFLPIEVAVSMTKALHNARLPADSGRWIFTKLDLQRLLQPRDGADLAVELKGNLHGRLTKSEIRAAGQPIGWIYFSLLPA